LERKHLNGTQAAAPPIPKDYFLGFSYMLDRQSTQNLLSLAQMAVNVNAKSITICITSNGGAPDQALYAYEVLTALPVPIYTHAIGTVQSAAVILFMSGSQRYASPGTNFLFHETVFNPGVATPSRFEDLVGQADAIQHNDSWSIALVAQRTGRTEKEVAEWFKGQQIRDTDFALKNGIIEQIRSLSIPKTAEFAQVAYKF
jgi:ATP-dependent Clp protease protease subunit